MNNIIITGRLARDPELRYTQSQTAVCNICVAVDRMPDSNGNRKADFFNCTAWRGTAEFISKYFKKGDGIDISGRMQNDPYEDKDGVKHASWSIMVNAAEFPHGRANGESNHAAPAQYNAPVQPQQTFVPMDDDGELPF